ncbi:helix-turn-helix DNA binding domain protein [Mycobacterium phage Suarez]|uniref:Helix-turn-helix DNA binding domain n=1 Tax=Mycobacterium phage Wildflower TaxID=3141619 RepID=A0AB38ZP30_9VIRU|nr:helix-turn-helix DNA binding domain protein [Mycobacterium phage Suarez]
MSDMMTGAELKVQLTGLGLTPVWLAERLGVASRTIIRWFDLPEVPAKAAAEIDRITQITEEEMHRLVTNAEHGPLGAVIRTERTDHQAVRFPNTLPATWHRALTYRVVHALRSSGLNVTVEYEDPFNHGASGESA